jgi:hypothetical protein
MFMLVSRRYERASLIDRLVHHADILALKGDSYRLKDRDLARPAPRPHGDFHPQARAPHDRPPARPPPLLPGETTSTNHPLQRDACGERHPAHFSPGASGSLFNRP